MFDSSNEPSLDPRPQRATLEPTINFGVRGSELSLDSSFPDRKAAYRAFLASPFWKDLSQQCVARDGRRCTLCPRTNHLHAHHVFYRDDWFETQLGDLKTLCEVCHAKVHGHERRVTVRRKAPKIWKRKKSKKRFGNLSMAERRRQHFKIFGGHSKKKKKRNRGQPYRKRRDIVPPGVFRGSAMHNGGHYKSPFEVPR